MFSCVHQGQLFLEITCTLTKTVCDEIELFEAQVGKRMQFVMQGVVFKVALTSAVADVPILRDSIKMALLQML